MIRIVLFLVIFLSSGLLSGQANYWSFPSPYQLSLKKEMFTGGAALIVFFTGTALEHHEGFIPFTPGSFTTKDINRINALDRGVAGQWDLKAMKESDFLKSKSKLAGQAAVLLFPGNLKARSSLLLMYLEGYYLTNGLTSFAKGVTDRKRPFAYLSEDQISGLDSRSYSRFMADIKGKDSEDSFFSGHACSTAYALTFLASTFSDYFPESRWKYGIWAISIAGIVAEDYFRVKSGKHFPTDVITGSLVGGGVGFLIPYIHHKLPGKKLAMSFTGYGLSVVYYL